MPRAKGAIMVAVFCARCLWSTAVEEKEVGICQDPEEVDAYDFVEVALAVSGAGVSNPFAEVEVSGRFGKKGWPERRVIPLAAGFGRRFHVQDSLHAFGSRGILFPCYLRGNSGLQEGIQGQLSGEGRPEQGDSPR